MPPASFIENSASPIFLAATHSSSSRLSLLSVKLSDQRYLQTRKQRHGRRAVLSHKSVSCCRRRKRPIAKIVISYLDIEEAQYEMDLEKYAPARLDDGGFMVVDFPKAPDLEEVVLRQLSSLCLTWPGA